MLKIKTAAIADIPLIRQIAGEIWPVTYTPIIGAEQVDYMLRLFYSTPVLQQQMEGGHTFFICHSNGRGIAFAAFSEIAAGIYKLHKLYILPDMQGQGIGSYIIGYISDIAKKQNAGELQLNVNRHNAQAISFYKKNGFTVIRDEDIDIGNGYSMNDYVLGMRLA